MHSSDIPESERPTGWEGEPGSDNNMDQDTLIRAKDSPEHLYDQDTDGEEPAGRRSS